MTEADIERIVQEVIRRLMSLGVHVDSSSPSKSALTIDDRVVSMASIEGRLDGVQQLVVQPKAVITPSVKDELRQKKIELVRA